VMTESAGRIGIGTTTPTGQLHVFGGALLDVFSGMGVDLAVGPAFNYGYSGASFGRSSGFFNIRPDASAVAPNPSLRFATGNVQRMIINNLGNVGIGTSNASFLLTLGGTVDRTIGMERAAAAGNRLTLQAGGALAGGSNLRGGDVLLAAGTGTGTGGSGDVHLLTAGSNGASGTTDNTIVDRRIIVGKAKPMSLAAPGFANVMSVALTGNQTAGGRINYTIRATDGGSQVATESGVILYLANASAISCTLSQTLNLGTVSAGCTPSFFSPGSQPGIVIFDNVVFDTPATITVHEFYYTIENESGSAIRLEP
jgi:hypothetical protein